MCSLAAILSVAPSSAVFAASDEYVVIGTVVSIEGGSIEIDEGKHNGRDRFEVILAGDVQTPKVGEKVRVRWYHCGSQRRGDFIVPIRLRRSAMPRKAPRRGKDRANASRCVTQ